LKTLLLELKIQHMNPILFTKDEVESKIFELEYEIEMFRQDGDTRRVQNRESKVQQLQEQKTVFTGDGGILNLEDATFGAYEFEHNLIFLQARFKNGFFLGFWSHSPWGTSHDQEQGWAVINPHTLEVVDYCETKCGGKSSGEFREWRKKMTSQYGKSNLIRNFSGEVEWKISGL
jgi:hypothetical protein